MPINQPTTQQGDRQMTDKDAEIQAPKCYGFSSRSFSVSYKDGVETETTILKYENYRKSAFYVSCKWSKDMTAAQFAVKLGRLIHRSIEICDNYIVIKDSGELHPEMKSIAMAKGEWFVYKNDIHHKPTLVGTYDDKGHEEEYEIVADWR